MKQAWWLRLTRHAAGQKSGLAFILGLMLLGIAVEALKPWPMKLLIDHVLPRRPLPAGALWLSGLPGSGTSEGSIAWIAASTILLFLMSQTLRVVQEFLIAGTGSRLTFSLGAELFDHLQHLSLRYHGQQRTGDLMRRVTADSSCVRDLVLSVFLPCLSSVVTLFTMFLIMWRMDQVLSLIAVLVVLPLFGLIKWLTKPMEERTYRQHEVEGEMMALAEQNLSALPIVQAFGRERREDRRFRQLSRRTVQAYLQALFTQLQFKIGVGAVTAIGTAAIILIGGLHVLNKELSIGSLIVFLSYLASLYAPVQGLAYVSSGFASAAGGARRVLEVLDVDDRIADRPDAQPLIERSGSSAPGQTTPRHVRLESVTFGYEPERPVLQGINLEARPGETVAIVGPTGAGKSSIVSLIPRLFDPWEGRVSFDGRDVRDIPLANLREQVSIVLQEPFLLPLTVAENVAYGRPDASRQEIEAAVRAANAHDFVERLPQGYDTVVGERGAGFSGGERQRLSIARALLKNAPVLILDEPTSALDVETEQLLLQALERLIEGRTTFIIAHRLSTIRRADRIVVLEAGRVVESGRHQDLLEQGHLYARFHHLQAGQAVAGEST